LKAMERDDWKPQKIGAAVGPVPNVHLTDGNLARLRAVGLALECDPTSLLNNFICDVMDTPSTIADGMDFDGDAEAERRVVAVAREMDYDDWGCEHFYPADGKAVEA